MGATNPANAAEGTIRKRFAANIERNCIHGSDAPETAAVGAAVLLQHGGSAVGSRPSSGHQDPELNAGAAGPAAESAT